MSIALAANFFDQLAAHVQCHEDALDPVPRGVDPTAVQSYLSTLPGLSEFGVLPRRHLEA
jgi:hypothetical protein